jgi:transitional endoplasmic reticulum ATPase
VTSINADQERLLSVLAEIGGKGMKEEDIIYEGTKLLLPERWRGNLWMAVDYIHKKIDEEDQIATFQKTFYYRPYDGAFNAFSAMKKSFGMVTGKTIRTFFGNEPPEYIQVPISFNETDEAPWGSFTLPMLDNTTIHFGSTKQQEFGLVFHITIDSPRKNRFIIEGLFIAIGDEIKKNSIYRGKAIDGQETPQFIDLSSVDPSQIVYSNEVETDLSTHIWSPIKFPEPHRKLNLPLKRAVLLQGPFGTGKSEAARLTAKIAVENGWTFIMARPGRDDFYKVMQTARLYQPAVVFMEDAEVVAAGNDQDAVSKVLDIFDGIQAKGNDLMVVLTTNHPEQIHEGMRRAGRLDAVISIGALDATGIEKLIRRRVSNLADDVDFSKVVVACEGYVPSFIKEVADRSIRYTLNRQEGSMENFVINTNDLVSAAQGLRAQFDWMQEGKQKEPDALTNVVEKSVQRAVAGLTIYDEERDYVDWNREILDAVKENGH